MKPFTVLLSPFSYYLLPPMSKCNLQYLIIYYPHEVNRPLSSGLYKD